jgi:STE24 endopeptidase
MQLAILIAVICALAHGQAPAEPVGGAAWRAALVLCGMWIPPLAAALGSLSIVRGLRSQRQIAPADCQRIWASSQSSAVMLWLATVAATMYLLDWPRVVRSDWSLGRWPLVDDVLILLPVVAPLLLLWSLMHRLQTLAARAFARAQGRPPPRTRLWAFLGLQCRQQLALILAPAMVVIGAQDLAALAWPAGVAGGRLWWLHLPLLAAMLVLLPLLLQRIWHTSPLPAGPLRERLTAVCGRERLGVRDVLVWHTDGHTANAAVAGLVRGLRYVFLTDGLLARLTHHEVEAVVRHELGHISGRHMLLRMLLLGLPLALGAAVEQTFPGTAVAFSRALSWLGMGQSLQVALIVPIGYAAYAVLVVGSYSKWLEHDADLAVCVTRGGTIDRAGAESFGRALVKVAGRGATGRFNQWLHPPVGQRLAVVALALADPAMPRRFRRRLSLVAGAIVASYLAIAALLLV